MLPHIRVFFWVPLNAMHYEAFVPNGVKSYILGHGPAEQWSVAGTGQINQDEKLVYVTVPKTFMIVYGLHFYKLVHLHYSTEEP